MDFVYLLFCSYWYEGTTDYHELRELYASISELQVCVIFHSFMILSYASVVDMVNGIMHRDRINFCIISLSRSVVPYFAFMTFL